MKKLILILVLGVFAFGSSGFKSGSLNDDPVDCENLQHAIFAYWYNWGVGADMAWDESIMFYEACMSNNHPDLSSNNQILPR